MSTRKIPEASQWRFGWPACGLALFAVLLAILCAKPIVDSDLWYHLAYGRQMLGSGSLVVDHTVFSWTPSDNAVIYCAWIAQLLFLAVHGAGGLPALFALRYAVFAAVFVAGLAYAHRTRTLAHPLVPLAATLTLLMSSGAFFIKPQLASYALMSATVVLCAWIRQRGDSAGKWLFALPVLMVIWVNTHGGFVVGLCYLGAVGAGELLNTYLSPSTALSPSLRRRLLIAIALCGVATFVTPYGARYPLQFFSVELPAIDLRAVREYDSIFADTQRPLRYVEYGAAALALLVALSMNRLRRGATEWGLVLTNVVFAGLYAYYVRLTFFWAPIVFVSVVTLLADRPRWLWPTAVTRARALGGALLAATVLLGAHAVRADMATPVVGSWVGFGNGYWNPEEEAEYIARHFPVERIGNDYNAGGYLIWRLGPTTKVFMDARYFPYRSWFQEYLTLETTAGIESLLQKYRADVWCVELLLPRTVAWFRTSPDWVPAFYGASAAVFVRRGTPLPEGRPQAGERVGEIRNLYQAIVVLAFAFDLGDLAGAERVVRGMEERFTADTERPIVAGARTALDGLEANARGDHPVAIQLLSQIAAAYQGMPAAALAQSAIAESERLWRAADDASALRTALLATRFAPQSPVAQYNAGAIGWWLQHESRTPSDRTWRSHLEAFLGASGRDAGGMAAAIDAARRMLNGQAQTRPFVLGAR